VVAVAASSFRVSTFVEKDTGPRTAAGRTNDRRRAPLTKRSTWFVFLSVQTKKKEEEDTLCTTVFDQTILKLTKFIYIQRY